MPRPILPEVQLHPAIRHKVATRHADIIAEVQAAVAAHEVVVVGMAQNPHPPQALRLLRRKQIEHVYLRYGSYLSEWRRRNALKMWTGWATFPMVFVHGVLVGGASDLIALDESGALAELLAGGRAAQLEDAAAATSAVES